MGQRLVISVLSGDKLLATAYYHWSGYTGPALEITSEALDKYDELKGKRMKKLNRAVEILWATGARMRLCDYAGVYGRLLNFKDMKFTDEQIAALTKAGITEDMFRKSALAVDDYLLNVVGYDSKAKFETPAKDPWHSIKIPLTVEEREDVLSAFNSVTLNRNSGLLDVVKGQMKNAQCWSEMDVSIDINTGRADVGGAFFSANSEADYRKDCSIDDDVVINSVPLTIPLESINGEQLGGFLDDYDEGSLYVLSDGSVVYSFH